MTCRPAASLVLMATFQTDTAAWWVIAITALSALGMAHVVAPATTGDGSRRLQTLAENEREHVQRVLDSVDWNKKEAARVLEISRGTLYRKIVEYNLRPESRLSRNRSSR